MWDTIFKVSFYSLTGLLLIGACTWYVKSLYDYVTDGGDVMIAAFNIVDSKGTTIEKSGDSLAEMLSNRLQETVGSPDSTRLPDIITSIAESRSSTVDLEPSHLRRLNCQLSISTSRKVLP